MEDTTNDNSFDIESAFNFIKEKDGRDVPFIWKLIHGKLEESDYEYECDELDLDLGMDTPFCLPSGLKIKKANKLDRFSGYVRASDSSGLTEIQDNVYIEGDTSIEYCNSLEKIGKSFKVDGYLSLHCAYGLEKIGDGLTVGGKLTMFGDGSLVELPNNMRVNALSFDGFRIPSIPYNLHVKEYIEIYHTFSVDEIKQTRNIKALSGDAIEKLEKYIKVLIEQRGGSVGGNIIITQ